MVSSQARTELMSTENVELQSEKNAVAADEERDVKEEE